MDKFVPPHDKEFMKMAILKHEETFKEQVYELHRLYQIQKMLMKNMQRSRPKVQNQERWNSTSGTISFKYQNNHDLQHQDKLQKQHKNNFDLEQPAAKEYDHVKETSDDHDENGELEIVDESELELTLGPTSYNQRRRKNKPESTTPLTSDSVPSFSSSSTGSSHIKRVERITRGNSSFLSGGRNNSSSAMEEHLRQADISLKQPPWMYQVLSLNMT